jgi:hypothetical protein
MKPVAAAAAALAVTAGVAGAGSQADVTLSLRQYANPNSLRVLVWHGQVASTAAGEEVAILGRGCTTSSFRQLITTKTLPGGGYEVESVTPASQVLVLVDSGTTFRARWRDQLSNTVTFRVPFPTIYAKKVTGRRAWRVIVSPSPIDMNLAGRFVELQRFRSSKWVGYKRARLVYKPSLEYGGAYNHQAIFEVPARGLKLRAFLPAKSAAPCYLANATEQWRS